MHESYVLFHKNYFKQCGVHVYISKVARIVIQRMIQIRTERTFKTL